MARREVPGRTPGVSNDLQGGSHNPRPPTTRLALTILQFCEAFNISEAFYYKLKKQGQGPREMEVGARKLISLEAADAWRRERESRHEP